MALDNLVEFPKYFKPIGATTDDNADDLTDILIKTMLDHMLDNRAIGRASTCYFSINMDLK